MKRRSFLKKVALSAGAWLGVGPAASDAQDTTAPASSPAPPAARPVTRGPLHHFCGYYDKCPWDATGRYLLALEVAFIGRDPRPGEAVTLGRIDLQQGDRFLPFDTTPAWCWQQGTMLQWLGTVPDREVVYNSVEGDHYISIIRDLQSGRTRGLPRPVYDVSGDGRQAVTLDFERLNRLRPGYGYAALPERSADDPAPANTGIWRMDMATGTSERIVSLAFAASHRPLREFAGAHHWFNHLKFNPSGGRFLFLHRWRRPTETRFNTRLYTANPDGSGIRLWSGLTGISHFDWRDDETVLVWAATEERGAHFYLINDRTGAVEVFADGLLTRDGHCSFSPDRRWVLVDTYPDRQGRQHLMLYRPADRQRIEMGSFATNPALRGSFRCDLHPRWNRDGTQVCLDSSHEPKRQVYVLDVRAVTRSAGGAARG